MQQNELPKAIKRAMRSLVALAHEAELGRALEELRFPEMEGGRD
jgi:hypothetical protein